MVDWMSGKQIRTFVRGQATRLWFHGGKRFVGSLTVDDTTIRGLHRGYLLAARTES